jgi:uncharacterized protein (TIGR03086 family)
MTDPIIVALTVARSEIERRLIAIGDADWDLPTPCAEWDVRTLVNHIVSHEYRFADNIATNSPDYYLSSRDDDFLGDDALRSWHTGVRLLDNAIARLGCLDATICFRVPLPARDVLALRVFEAAVHCWDLSRAVRLDERIDERLAVLTLPVFERLVQVPAIQAFFAAPTRALPSTARPHERLLHLAGRTL